jgi:hypothetical protein
MADPNDPNDFTDRYNTALTSDQEQQYQQWLQAQSAQNNRDMSGDAYDYDLRGAFLNDAGAAANGHYPDTFKKPNHPTFSDQSQYSGADGYVGGHWSQDGQNWTFTPGPTNMMGPDALQDYFQRAEPGNTVILPGSREYPKTLFGDFYSPTLSDDSPPDRSKYYKTPQ